MANGIAYKTGSDATVGVKVVSGDVVDILHSLLTFEDTGDALVNEGQPVAAGNIVGMALDDASAVTQYVPVSTKGVYNFSVDATNGIGNVAVSFGDDLFISSTGTINADPAGTFFGTACATISSGASQNTPVLIGAPGSTRGGGASSISISAQEGKVGATAGWVVTAATDICHATLPAGVTAGTLAIPVSGLPVGSTVIGFEVHGQVESGGNTATLDADLRKTTTAAGAITDASVGAITQVSETADAVVAATKDGLSETIADAENLYILLTGTTAASTDLDITHVIVHTA